MANDRQMTLTPELVARVHRAIEDTGPEQGVSYHKDEDYDACVRTVLAQRDSAHPIWLFAYGSLIWKPEIGMQFNSGELGAWYAAAALTTAVAEVAHHLRREAVARGILGIGRTFRAYTCTLAGSYLDIRGQQAIRSDVYAPDSYVASQALGEAIRAPGGAGIIYDSLRHMGGVNVVAHRPRNVLDVVQTDHLEIAVEAASKRIAAMRVVA